MGRGHRGAIAATEGNRRKRRQARQAVQRAHGTRLRQLSKADRYKVGDVSRRLLLALAVDVDEPSKRWEPRLRQLLPGRAHLVFDVGLSGALIRDGVNPLPSVQQLLERVAEGRAAQDADGQYHEMLARFRRAARERRDAELDWLSRHLRLVPVIASEPWDGDATRALLLRIWLEGAGPHDLPRLVDEVVGLGSHRGSRPA